VSKFWSNRASDPFALFGFGGLAKDKLHVNHIAVYEFVPMFDDVVMCSRERTATPMIWVIAERVAIRSNSGDGDIWTVIAWITTPP
jgi:hypothetical protein